MTTKRVYIAFDYDDLDVKQNLIAQSKLSNCPFEIIDGSIVRAVTGSWAAEADRLIAASDCLIVLCGEQTHQAPGVLTELQIAQKIGKPYFLLSGTRKGVPTHPRNARASDKIWPFRWATVKTLLAGGTPPDDIGR